MPAPSDDRMYWRSKSVVFYRTRDHWGFLSNMAPGFPLVVNGLEIPSSEALYQSFRFPHLPHIQSEIISQRSPMVAKMKSRKHYPESRPDWDRVRVAIMRWCLRVKLLQHQGSFGAHLIATGDQPIVEQSRRDRYWGAIPLDEEVLVGRNVLGRLLMELRQQFAHYPQRVLTVAPPLVPDLRLLGRPVAPMAQEIDLAVASSSPKAEPLELFPDHLEMSEPHDSTGDELITMGGEESVEDVAVLLREVAERLDKAPRAKKISLSLRLSGIPISEVSARLRDIATDWESRVGRRDC